MNEKMIQTNLRKLKNHKVSLIFLEVFSNITGNVSESAAPRSEKRGRTQQSQKKGGRLPIEKSGRDQPSQKSRRRGPPSQMSVSKRRLPKNDANLPPPPTRKAVCLHFFNLKIS